MKNALFAVFLTTPIFAVAQKLDSSVVKILDSLHLLIRSQTLQSNFEQALATNQIAENLALKHAGKMSEAYAGTCFSRGRTFFFKGDFSNAEKWYLEAKDIREKTDGTETAEYAWSLNNLGTLYWKMRLLEKAEKQLLQSKVIRERLFGKLHLDHAHSLNNLGLVYKDMGEFEKSLPCLVEALEIRRKLLGTANRDYAWSLNNLANLYWEMGDLEKSETLQLEALAVREKVAGKKSNDYAASLGNLGLLAEAMGDQKKAESYYLRCKNLREELTETGHPDYAGVVSNLAALYSRMNLPARAEPLFVQSIELFEKIYGRENPSFAIALLNLANFYQNLEKWEQAEPICLQAKTILENSISKEHTDFAKTLLAIGINQIGKKEYDLAEKSLLQAKENFQKKSETRRQDYLRILEELIECNWLVGKSAQVEALILEKSNLQKQLLTKAAKHLSERELQFYIKTYAADLEIDCSFAQNQSSFASSIFDELLFHKGFLLNAVQQIQILAAKNPVAAEQFAQLKTLNRRLATEFSKPIEERKNTAELEEKANALEKELARTVANFGAATQQVSWQQVQQKLRAGEVAIEFIDYQFSNPKPTDERWYAALVLRPGAEQPVFVPLFEEKKLQALLDPQSKSKVNFVNQLYSNSLLFDLVWQPLESKIGSGATVYFSPSGLLHRLNFGAFPVGNQTLADKYRFVSMGSTRQLVVPAEVKNEEKTALLFGGIQYDFDSTAFTAANQNLTQNLSENSSENFSDNSLTTRRGLNFENVDSTLRGGDSWAFLKWTNVEIDLAAAILHDANFKINLKKDFAASEDFFKTIGTNALSPKILHLATHGFFFPEVKGEKVRGAYEPVFKISEHPMIRSGLVLAGANHAWKTGKLARSDREDGILTAYEISQMNLSNTELVILSACETGLGDLRGNEGVYGLQRAFRIAGAKYLVMSLWQTSDFHTQELMSNFYSRWLDDKIPIPDAFRAAQAAMRLKFRDPFFWAGFVLIGD